MEEKRHSGRTTRMIDQYIQWIFDSPNEWITIEDHHNDVRNHKDVFEKIKRRLISEHEGLIKYGCIVFDASLIRIIYEK